MSVCPGQFKGRCFSGESAAVVKGTAVGKKLCHGFTLIELMISLILMGVLINLVSPLVGMTENARQDYINQSLYSSVVLARSEAIKRSENVSLCQSNSGTGCDGNADWTNGWVIFVNPDNDNVIDTGEEVIRVYNAISSPFGIAWSNGNLLTFVPRGSSVTAGDFTVCPDNTGGPDPSQVSISGTGQVQRSTGTGSC